VVLADANFTAMSLGAGKPVLRLPGVGMLRTLEAVVSVFPLAEDVTHPVAYMHVSDTAESYRSALQREAVALLASAGLPPERVQAVERYEFYERVKKAYAIVVTGELEPWGNFLLRKGVLGQPLRP
jgi:L-fucose mutarotase